MCVSVNIWPSGRLATLLTNKLDQIVTYCAVLWVILCRRGREDGGASPVVVQQLNGLGDQSATGSAVDNGFLGGIQPEGSVGGTDGAVHVLGTDNHGDANLRG